MPLVGLATLVHTHIIDKVDNIIKISYGVY